MIMTFVKEVLGFLEEVASGELKIEEARTRAAELNAQKPEELSDLLLAELDKKIADLEARPTVEPPFEPGDMPDGSSDR